MQRFFVTAVSFLAIVEAAFANISMFSRDDSTETHELRKRDIDASYICKPNQTRAIINRVDPQHGAIMHIVTSASTSIAQLRFYLSLLSPDVVASNTAQIAQMEQSDRMRSTWYTYAALYNQTANPRVDPGIHDWRLQKLEELTDWVLVLITNHAPLHPGFPPPDRVQITCSDFWLTKKDHDGRRNPDRQLRWDARPIEFGGPDSVTQRKWIRWPRPFTWVHDRYNGGHLTELSGAVITNMTGLYGDIIMLNPYMWEDYWDHPPRGYTELMTQAQLQPNGNGTMHLPIEDVVGRHLEATLMHLLSQCRGRHHRDYSEFPQAIYSLKTRNVRDFPDIIPFGWEGCLKLARRSPKKAWFNADNFTFFVFALAMHFADWSTGVSRPMNQVPPMPTMPPIPSPSS